MTLQRYLVEEIALDHVEGLLSRREALRRMAMMGVGAVAASGSGWSGSASGKQ